MKILLLVVEIKSRIFYPKDKEHLESVKLITNQLARTLSSGCVSTLWVPFRNKNGTSMEWTHDKKWEMEERVDFGPWKVDNDQTGRCMFFSLAYETFIPANCDFPDTNACAFCELDQERLIYNFQAMCNMNLKPPDSQFILTQENMKFFLTGRKGFSIIRKTSKDWQVNNNPHRRRENVANATDSWSTPFGLKKWDIESCKETKASMVKLSNVS